MLPKTWNTINVVFIACLSNILFRTRHSIFYQRYTEHLDLNNHLLIWQTISMTMQNRRQSKQIMRNTPMIAFRSGKHLVLIRIKMLQSYSIIQTIC